MFLVVGSLLLCAGLFGCDNRPQATVSAPVAVTAPPPTCNCTQPPPPPAPVVQTARAERRHISHHRHTVAEFERMYPGYGESDQSTSSQSETRDYSDSRETMTQDESGPMRKVAWVDGYGRAHYASDDASQDENPARLNREERHVRRDPYRGWNSDCDERDAVN
jgi:hypothetical protein